MRIELLTSPGCPNADPARRVVMRALTSLGIDMPIVDQVGRFRSPTVLVDGVDVMGPDAGPLVGDACRLDLPTPDAVARAVRAALDSDRPADRPVRQVR